MSSCKCNKQITNITKYLDLYNKVKSVLGNKKIDDFYDTK